MSLVIEGKYIIHHIPKTGGFSVRALLDYNGIEYTIEHGPRRNSRPYINEMVVGPARHHLPVEPEGRPALVFVRTYVDWYRSFYGFRTEARKPLWGWKDIRPFDRKCRADSFTEFMGKVGSHYPDGFLRHLFTEYASVSTEIRYVDNLFESLRAWIAEYLHIAIQDSGIHANATEALPIVTDADRRRVYDIEGSWSFEQ